MFDLRRFGKPGVASLILIVGVVITAAVWRSNTRSEQKSTQLGRAEIGVSSAIRQPRTDISLGFAGSESCAECHAEINEAYRSSAMGQSLWRIGTESPLEDYDQQNSFSPDGRHHYSIVRTDDGVFHHERLADNNGETIYDQSVRIEFVIGSGTQGRSYLFNRNGMLYMSPVGWYANGKRWDLSPGFKLPFHRRFSRRIPFACMECHASQMNQTSQTDVFGDPPFREFAIGCERCHGPGVNHIGFHKQKISVGTDPIINPSRLDPHLREDVCTQCHLSGEGRYLREGSHFGGFLPGTRLEETYLIFVGGKRTSDDGRTRAVSQVEQMRSSRCYMGSEGRMGCTSCHDPHSKKPEEEQQVVFHRGRCLACHSDHGCAIEESERRERQADDSCIACHMPKLEASDVPHTTQTDHRILRLPKTSAVPESKSSIAPELYDDAEKRLPEVVVAKARGMWLAERAERYTNRNFAEQASRILKGVLVLQPDDVEVLEALGTCAAISGRTEESLSYCTRVMTMEPHRERTLLTAATMHLNEGKLDTGRRLMEEYLKVQPNDALAWGRYSGVLSQLNETQNAITAGRKSAELDPSNPRTWSHLAELYGRIGDGKQEETCRALGRRVQFSKTP